MKVPPKRKGNQPVQGAPGCGCRPSMKVPPKRKGNEGIQRGANRLHTLNESPSEKEGKSTAIMAAARNGPPPSMKVPPKRKGNGIREPVTVICSPPSMKVPPKRKGNAFLDGIARMGRASLNESPSEKEGKFRSGASVFGSATKPSMKVPPKRKGNLKIPDWREK